MNEETLINLTIDERTTRALTGAITFTLEKWTGQEPIDQEQLLALKPFMQGCCLEFDFDRMSS